MQHGLRALLGAIFLSVLLSSAVAAEDGNETSFADAIAGLRHETGLLDVYMDEDGGRVLLALPAAEEGNDVLARFIAVEYLAAGLGSNPVGLDRSQPGNTIILAFRRVAGKILAEAENWRYVASADNPLEQKAVKDSFATSVLWAAPVIATAEDGRSLIDYSSFLLRDAHGIAATLERTGQGSFRLDTGLSVVEAGASLVFPENIELEATLTWTGSKPGGEVRATTPEPGNITLRAHYSLVQLPDDEFRPRADDPRAGTFGRAVSDYSAPLTAPVVTSLAARHRLEKTDPAASSSPVKEPIIYYVDSGAPKIIQQALIDGASWWAEAFADAGFEDAFRVEVLPEGAHLLDVRYNVINWVHRATRGWSYGASVTDPRTGEIIKGHVLLGSLRVRQDRMIFEGLVGVEATGSGGPNDPLEAALARVRQLSAHEVGHTLGFAHNMAASTTDRASVMDYPAPEVGITEDGSLDLSNAYAVGIGVWDKFTVKYLYSEFAPGSDEKAALDQIILDAYGSGLVFVSDPDSRAQGTAHPRGALWDTGEEVVSSLQHTMEVRRIALENFGLRNIREGQRVSDLQQVIVPIYLYHRYQLEAALKVVGGMVFNYGVKGDGMSAVQTLDPDYQRHALTVILATLDPNVLDLSDQVLERLSPRHRNFFDQQYDREIFASAAFPAFDLLGAAQAAAGMTIDGLLHPARLSRLIEFKRRDSDQLGIDEVLAELIMAVFNRRADESSRKTVIRQAVQERVVSALITLAQTQDAGALVRSHAEEALRAIETRLGGSGFMSWGRDSHASWLGNIISAHFDRPITAADPGFGAPEIPPGSPIGSPIGDGTAESCWHCR